MGKTSANPRWKQDSPVIRITHPTHPLRGQSFPVLPQNGGRPDPSYLNIALPNGECRFIPIAWTDQAAPFSYPLGACFRPENLVTLRQRLDELLARLSKQAMLEAQASEHQEPRDSHADHRAEPLGPTERRAARPDHRSAGTDAAAPPDRISGGGA